MCYLRTPLEERQNSPLVASNLETRIDLTNSQTYSRLGISLSRHLNRRTKVFLWSLAFRKERELSMLENGVLRKILGPKKEEVKRRGRKLLSKRLRDIYSSSNIVRVMKSRKVKRAEPAARMGEKKIHTRFWWKTLKENTFRKT